MLTAIDPSTGTLVREVPLDDSATIERKLAAAAQAFTAWRAASFTERGALLQAVADHMRAHKDSLGAVMTEEMGKPVREARGEVEKAAWCAEHYATHAEGYLQEEVLASDATYSSVRYLPLGATLGIMPWNAPFWLPFRYCAPALMAGNTCLLKHDSHTPGCAQALAGIFTAVGAPSGLFDALMLKGSMCNAVIQDPRIQAISFTGSSGGGAQVAAVAAAEIKPAVLELGGSDPAIVLADCTDLAQAADVITLSRIINAGQSCIAAKRIIVEAPVYDEMIDLLAERLAKLVVCDPREERCDVGPIARPELRQELHDQVQRSVEAGARCLLGGTLPEGPGYFYPVTLLVDVKPGQACYVEETFGPVAVVVQADDAAHAVRMANDTPYGLAASIWGSTERAVRMASAIDAGQVAVNGIVKTDPRLPSGGIKRSGYGRELGPHGIKEFVNTQQLWVGPKQG